MTQHEPTAPSALEQGRPDRPLGRGLEDVSHVFLSQRAHEGERDPAAPRRPERPRPRDQPAAPTPVLLRPAAQITREQVAAALKEHEAAIETGMTTIDAGIPCPPHDEIDLLAVDRLSQLTIIDFDTTSNDELLLRGLCHFDWALRNIANLARMFRGQSINFTLQPRVVLLAPEFSARMRSVARHVTRPYIYWARYHLVEASGHPGLFFEPLSLE
jgi:hypothetical protein